MVTGFINVLKPPGLTSHDVVQQLRRILKEKKIGHAGTLDPLAAGVLPVAAGKATRLLEYLQAGDKAYRAEFILGLKTDTQDLDGSVLARTPCPPFTEGELQAAALPLTGPIFQVPPMASAVHYQGRRLYELAWEGLEVERPARPVTVYQFQVLKAWRDPPYYRALVDITCSRGTYVRTLGADWGDRLGVGATLAFLLRTAAGTFQLTAAWTLEEIEAMARAGNLEFILPPAAGLQHLAAVTVPGDFIPAVRNGVVLKGEVCRSLPAVRTGDIVRLEDGAGQLLALARVAINNQGAYLFKPHKVL
ncbi:tRNA pseudouridine(55) synthase TruB [Moorella sp. Hama-1]|uniref:tRNA pseudouridine(55) synthase TruB n=1 Tax=Moorella sp. Hama-1 TaxID=2138101 RepID=UPI000D641EAB|nr:tRNA pseudouridine(55) synthase TruB [Moorella sp. Hama-1]MDN5361609.1 tRNA pseudouridine55 synthase [Moorella sp. (in: firmicutes)]BCV21137.1 tRNA pseudouridine synthase B [Moorella sp. Hama-1]